MTDAPERTPLRTGLSQDVLDVFEDIGKLGREETAARIYSVWTAACMVADEVVALEQERARFEGYWREKRNEVERLRALNERITENAKLMAERSADREILSIEVERLRAAIREIADEMNKAWDIWLNEADAPVRQLEEWGGEIHHGVQARVSAWEGKLRALTKHEGE